jgi:hypothetical protein
MNNIRYHVTVTNPAALSNIDVICKTHPFVGMDDGNYRGCVDVTRDSAASLEALFDIWNEVIEYSAENL